MRFPRVIPTLLIEDDSLVKGEKFSNHRYVGDPVNTLRIFNEKQVDEICILDIENSRTSPNYQMISECASEAFIPLSYGGQISELDHIKTIFDLGVEKIIFNSSLHNDHALITKTAAIYGAQSVVVKIDYKSTLFGKKKVLYNGVQNAAEIDLKSACHLAETLGAGEIILADINRDGSGKGYDVTTLSEIALQIKIPVLGCCGAKDLHHIADAVNNANCSGVVAGDMFTFYGQHKAVLPTYPDYQELLKIWN